MKTLCAVMGGLALLCAGEAWAFDLDPSEIRGKSSKEPVSVLQNRYFLKAFRPEVGLTSGFLLDQAYLNTTTVGARAGMFVDEWLGFEVEQLQTRNSDSEDRKALDAKRYRPLTDPNAGNATPPGTTTETTVKVAPEVNAIYSITDFNAVAAPLYGKLNVFNKMIIYTDVYMTGGVSRLATEQGDKTGLILGAGERFYVGKAWSMRIDFKDRIFTESRGGQDSRKHSKAINFGGSYFFN